MSEGDAAASKNMAPSVVFWDIIDFPFIDCTGSESIYNKMKSFLAKEGCYGDLSIRKFYKNFTVELSDDTFGTRSKEGGESVSESARVHRMVVDIGLWALENPANCFAPLNLIVISRNIKEKTDFLRFLEALRYRYYNVLLVLPHSLSSTKLISVSFECFMRSVIGSDGALQFFEHKPMRREGDVFSELLKYRYIRGLHMCDIPVFWDPEAFQVAETAKIDIFKNIKVSVFNNGYYGDVLIRPYVNNGFTREKFSGYVWDPEWLVTEVPEGDEYAKFTRMSLDILFWAMNNRDVPTPLMLISKPFEKSDFVLEALERRGFSVILGPPLVVNQLTADYFDSSCKILDLTQPSITQSEDLYYEQEDMRGGIVIFLNVKDWPCIIPRLLYSSIKATLERRGYIGDVSMVACYDEESTHPSLIYSYNCAGFCVRPTGRIISMLLDMVFLADIERYGAATVMVISKLSSKDEKLLRKAISSFSKVDITVLVALPDLLWATLGRTSVWSAKFLYEGTVF